MELEFLGVRGSMPVSGDDRNKYGGHTLCACIVTSDGEWIIIDAGTGISKLGDIFASQEEEKPQNHHLLLTHFHLDHITGLPFFAPLYSSKATLNFHTAYDPKETEEYLSGLMAGRYFPLEFKDATDTEHPEEGTDQKLVSLARGADILVYDAMFTPEEYESGKQGWGHSTGLEGTKVAEEAKVGALYLSHFNPDHSDKQIDEIISMAREKFSQTYGAREGHKEIL